LQTLSIDDRLGQMADEIERFRRVRLINDRLVPMLDEVGLGSRSRRFRPASRADEPPHALHRG
jgi:hypothetical protein